LTEFGRYQRTSMAIKLTLLVFAACIVGYTLAVSCYVCYSHLDSTCNDKYKSPADHLTDCGDDVTGCSKTHAIGKFEGSRYKSLNRTCGVIYDNAICKFEDAYPFEDASQSITDSEVWQCSCEGDSCNTGSHVSYSLSAFVLTAVTAFLVR